MKYRITDDTNSGEWFLPQLTLKTVHRDLLTRQCKHSLKKYSLANLRCHVAGQNVFTYPALDTTLTTQLCQHDTPQGTTRPGPLTDGYPLDGLSQDTDVRDHGPSEGDAETSLCDKCAIIRIDDKKWAHRIEKRDGGRGAPFVTFPEFKELFSTEERIELAYEREDTYPDLPALEQGSMNGCKSCKLLRESLQEQWAISKSERQGIARIHTRKISYVWTGMGTRMRILSHKPCPPKPRRANLKLDFDWINDTASPVSDILMFEFFSDQGL